MEVTISVEASPWPRSPASSVVQGASREVQKIRDDLIAALQSAVRTQAENIQIENEKSAELRRQVRRSSQPVGSRPCDPVSRGAHGLQLDESERLVLAANAQVDNLKVQMDGLHPKATASTITALSRSDSSQPTSAAAPSAPQQAAAAVSPNVAPGQSPASHSMAPPPPRPPTLPSAQPVSVSLLARTLVEY